MKPAIYLAVVVITYYLNSASFAREVEGASPGDRGRTSDARGGQTGRDAGKKSEGGGGSPAGGGGNRGADKRNDGGGSTKSESKPDGGNTNKTDPTPKETSGQQAEKDLKNVSEGIGKMIERNEKQLKELKAKGTPQEKHNEADKVHAQEAKKALERAAKHIHEKYKNPERNPVKEVLTNGKTAKQIAESYEKMETAKEKVFEAFEAQEKIGPLQEKTDKLKNAQNEVDKLREIYSEANKAPTPK